MKRCKTRYERLAALLSEATGFKWSVSRVFTVTEGWVTEKGRPRNIGLVETWRYTIHVEPDDPGRCLQFGEFTHQEVANRLSMLIDLARSGYMTKLEGVADGNEQRTA